MTLTAPNHATNKLNVSSRNLDAILSLKKVSKDDVTTKLVISCFEEIAKSQLGWWHSIKKFFARTFTYTATLALPVGGIVGGVWYFVDVLKNMNSMKDLANCAFWGTSLGALLAADFAIGRVVGTRPITAVLIAAYDAYREGARTLSKQVTESYTNYENEMRDIVKKHRQTIKTQLLETYTGIAEALAERYTTEGATGFSPEIMKSLTESRSLISKIFADLGLSKTDIEEILSPLNDTIQLLSSSSS